MHTPGLLRFLFEFESEEPYLYECRACGTTVDETVEECPNCGRAEIAEIHLC